jgi:uncharacterized protein
MRTSIATLVIHLMAAYFIVAAPLLGRWRYRKRQRQMQAGDALAKLRLYRTLVINQGVNIAVFCALWVLARVPAAQLGLGAPRSWWLCVSLIALVVSLMAWSVLRLRPKASEIGEKLRSRAAMLLPESRAERRWFALVCLGGGISEELIFRGFLFYYFIFCFPHINNLENALLTSAIFGIGHLYQGWKGMLPTGVAGLILAGLYVLSGNLLLPIVAHVIGNMRVLLILQPGAGAMPIAQENT